MTMQDKRIEAAAKAICIREGGKPDDMIEIMGIGIKLPAWRDCTLRSIDALKAADAADAEAGIVRVDREKLEASIAECMTRYGRCQEMANYDAREIVQELTS